MGENLRRELLGRRKSMRDNYLDRRELGKWQIYGDAWYEYQKAFEVVFPEQIDHWLKERTAHGHPTMVLDVMAPAATIKHLQRDVGIDGGLALTLENNQTPEQAAADQQENIYTLGGDVVGKAVWRRVAQFRQAHFQPQGGFDLVLARPLGGIHNIPINRDIYFYLLQQLYQNTSHDDGVILTVVPPYTRANMRNWLRELDALLTQTPHIDHHIAESTYNGSPVLMLQKHPEAPASLTGLPNQPNS